MAVTTVAVTTVAADLAKVSQPLGAHLSTALAIDTGRDDATGIAGTLSTRKETLNANMHQGFAVSAPILIGPTKRRAFFMV